MVTAEDQVIQVDAHVDLVDLFFSNNGIAELPSDAMLGPATITNFEAFAQEIEASVVPPLVPTILGTIAEGIALSNMMDSGAASLSL